MKKEEAVVFNHKLRNSAEACGIDEKRFDKDYEDFINNLNNAQYQKKSEIVEQAYNKLSKMDLAYIVGSLMVQEMNRVKQ